MSKQTRKRDRTDVSLDLAVNSHLLDVADVLIAKEEYLAQYYIQRLQQARTGRKVLERERQALLEEDALLKIENKKIKVDDKNTDNTEPVITM